jgi:uncharacterized protein HemX
MRLRTRWVQILLSGLVLLTVAGGIAVGHFYWTSLRSSLGGMTERMSAAQERQQELLLRLDRGRTLMAAQQERLEAEAEALRRWAEDLAAERRRLAEEGEALASAWSRSEAVRGGEALARLRLAEAARLVESARERLSDAPDLEGAVGALIAAAALLDQADTSKAAAFLERTEGLRARIGQASPLGKAELWTRLNGVRARVAGLAPGAREGPWRRPAARGSLSPSRSLQQQLDVAAFALEQGDAALYRRSLETATLWIESFLDTRRPPVRGLVGEIGRLASRPPVFDLEELGAALEELAADMRAVDDARRAAETARKSSEVSGLPHSPPAVSGGGTRPRIGP